MGSARISVTPSFPGSAEVAPPTTHGGVPRLTVLAGPTAVGKGTVSADIRRRYPHIWLSVSATTRPPRPGEVDGVHYHFVDNDEFDAMIERGDLLEWAIVHGRNRYGTPRGPVEEQLAAGVPALLEIDLGRGAEDEEERARRLATARVELAAEREFDHVVINDNVERATDELAALMQA